MWPAIAIIVALIVVGLIAFIATRPTEFTVQRSARISAPRQVVFDQVNDFQKWRAWSPWEKMDPELKRTYSGSAVGAGSVYYWTGNNKVGEGRMTLTDSRPPELIRIKLEFIRPFACTNDVDFAFQPDGNQTQVTWTMHGRNNFMAKAFCLFMYMDKMIGRDFEKGLAGIKSIAESTAPAHATS